MTDQIVSRERIRAKGRAAFEAGEARDSHCMNWHALCLPDWLAGYDAAAAAAEAKQRGVAPARAKGGAA
jgi:hypothetical protein